MNTILLMLLFGYDPQVVALSFDDGPSVHTARLIKLLGDRKATFFVLGVKCKNRPKMYDSLRASGHQIGNHGWSHIVLRHLKPWQREKELLDTDKYVTAKIYRPPDGIPHYKFNVKRYGYKQVIWDIDSYDIEIKRKYKNHGWRIQRRMEWILLERKLSGVVLVHETSWRAIDSVIDRSTATFVTVTEMLAYQSAGWMAKPFVFLWIK